MLDTVADDRTQISEITARAMLEAKGASMAANAAIQCVAAAALVPALSMFDPRRNDLTLRERLLFTLILAGSCITEVELEGIHDYQEALSCGDLTLGVEISPANLLDALATYTKLTGICVEKFLPPAMVQFANSQQTVN